MYYAKLQKINYQNNILHVLINNSRTTGPTKILMQFLSFPGNLLQDNYIIFEGKKGEKKCWQFWNRVQMINDDSVCSSPIKEANIVPTEK